MTVEEVNKVVDELKAQGMTEQEVLAGFYAMYCDDKLTADELEAIIGTMGYEFSEEFKNMSEEDRKNVELDEEEGEVSKEEAEEAKQFEPEKEAPKPEEENKPEEEKPAPVEDKKPEPEPEEDEETRAKKLFGLK